MNRLHRIGIIVCTLVCCLVLPVACAQASTSSTSSATHTAHVYSGKVIAADTKWLASTQLDNGAFPDYHVKSGSVDICPYYADFVCLALLDGYNGSTDAYRAHPARANQVKSYMDWYFSHMNTSAEDQSGLAGTVCDYRANVSGYTHVKSETMRTTKTGAGYYDSTDSYAAEFLSVARAYYRVTGDRAYLEEHAADLASIVNVILQTMHGSLTYATPAYPVRYLMDNSEVYQGLNDASKLYRKVFPDSSVLREQIDNARSRVQYAIEHKLWTSKNDGHYWVGLNEDGSRIAFSWKRFYPDATAQVFPLVNGVTSAKNAHAKKAYRRFNAHWSTGAARHSWEKLQTTDENCWGSLVYAAAKMKDVKRSSVYMKRYYKTYASKHQYPLYNADSANVVRAAYLIQRSTK